MTVGRLRHDAVVAEGDGRVALFAALNHGLLHRRHLVHAAEPALVPLALVLAGRAGEVRVEEEGREADVELERQVRRPADGLFDSSFSHIAEGTDAVYGGCQ